MGGKKLKDAEEELNAEDIQQIEDLLKERPLKKGNGNANDEENPNIVEAEYRKKIAQEEEGKKSKVVQLQENKHLFTFGQPKNQPDLQIQAQQPNPNIGIMPQQYNVQPQDVFGQEKVLFQRQPYNYPNNYYNSYNTTPQFMAPQYGATLGLHSGNVGPFNGYDFAFQGQPQGHYPAFGANCPIPSMFPSTPSYNPYQMQSFQNNPSNNNNMWPQQFYGQPGQNPNIQFGRTLFPPTNSYFNQPVQARQPPENENQVLLQHTQQLPKQANPVQPVPVPVHVPIVASPQQNAADVVVVVNQNVGENEEEKGEDEGEIMAKTLKEAMILQDKKNAEQKDKKKKKK